jgi:hypothetical protein
MTTLGSVPPQRQPETLQAEAPPAAEHPSQLGSEGMVRPAMAKLPVVKKPAVRSGPLSPRCRVARFLLTIVVVLAAWWGSGYLFAYTDDAYLTSDLVSVTPEVSGPIETVQVTDNQWVTQGTLLFTIDPVPFRLELERQQALEAQTLAQLPIEADWY